MSSWDYSKNLLLKDRRVFQHSLWWPWLSQPPHFFLFLETVPYVILSSSSFNDNEHVRSISLCERKESRMTRARRCCSIDPPGPAPGITLRRWLGRPFRYYHVVVVIHTDHAPNPHHPFRVEQLVEGAVRHREAHLVQPYPRGLWLIKKFSLLGIFSSPFSSLIARSDITRSYGAEPVIGGRSLAKHSRVVGEWFSSIRKYHHNSLCIL